MRKGILISLILVPLALFAAAPPDDQVMNQARPDDPWVVFQRSGSYLGVDVRDVTSERVSALKLKDESGVEIVMVDQDAPAGKAGLREKDVILSFNGQKVDGAEQLRRMIRETPAGRTVNLGISRDGQPVNISVALGDAKKATQAMIRRQMVMPPIPPVDVDIPQINMMVGTTSRSGCMVENLTPQLAEFFGVKNSGGVLVRSVEKGSAAETAGLKAGDIVVRVDKEKINDMSDWRRALRARSGQVPVTIVRDRREQTVQMKLPEKKQGSRVGDGANTWISDLDDFNFDVDELQLELNSIRPQIEEGTKRMAMVWSDKNQAEMKKAMAEAQAAVKKFNEQDMKKIQKELERAREEMRHAFERDEM